MANCRGDTLCETDRPPEGQLAAAPSCQPSDTDRFDAGLAASLPVGPGTLHLRASAMTQAHNHQYH